MSKNAASKSQKKARSNKTSANKSWQTRIGDSLKPKEDVKTVSIIARILLGIVFFIVGFNFSNSIFFERNPLFGVTYLAEFLISFAFAAFGFHTIPLIFLRIKDWVESLLTATVSNIVWDFWEQQNKRMQAARKRRDKEQKKQSTKKLKEKYAGSLVLDTSVLIDGRILDIAKIGFLPGESLLVSQTVLDELHLLSDSEKDLKRKKGRRGLDILNDLKKASKVHITKEKAIKKGKNVGVDKEIVQLAKNYNLPLMTLDFNLNKVAKAKGVAVLNINDLVEAVKTSVLPGEKIKVTIVQEGKEKKQGVGYLPDGTMIVVEGANDKVGQEVEAKVSRLIQSPAGKMVFCSL